MAKFYLSRQFWVSKYVSAHKLHSVLVQGSCVKIHDYFKPLTRFKMLFYLSYSLSLKAKKTSFHLNNFIGVQKVYKRDCIDKSLYICCYPKSIHTRLQRLRVHDTCSYWTRLALIHSRQKRQVLEAENCPPSVCTDSSLCIITSLLEWIHGQIATTAWKCLYKQSFFFSCTIA